MHSQITTSLAGGGFKYRLCLESRHWYLSSSPGSIHLYGGQSHMRISARTHVAVSRERSHRQTSKPNGKK